MLSKEVKSRLKEWNETPDAERDWHKGLHLLVDASGNRSFLFTIRQPEKKKEFIQYQLKKYIRFAISEEEHRQVTEMVRKVSHIVKENLSLAQEKDENPHRGKRDDHDSLPDEIKAMYVENLDILRKIRELHLQLRNMTVSYRRGNSNIKCLDAERYPFLVEIIKLDKKMHENWKAYDSYRLEDRP